MNDARRELQLVCLDPGFASLGYARLVLYTGHVPLARVEEFGVMQTAKANKKQNVFAVEDNLRRTMEIAKKLRELVAHGGVRTVGICAEAMSFPRSSSVAAKMAMVWGAIASLSEATHVPVLQASPVEVKLAVCGVKTATKDEVIAAVQRLYPETKNMAAEIARGQHEHCHDAVAVGHLMLASSVVRMARLAA